MHHPSIVVWSGNNENEAALAENWYGTNVDKSVSNFGKISVTFLSAILQRVFPTLLWNT
jgi:beta-galactosidase/beta-glucuronidase